jgi:hypothetical protein
MAAHLAGAVAANTTLPVIGIPIRSSFDGMDALLATVQMPSGIPVATVAVNGAKNAALLACQILAVEENAALIGMLQQIDAPHQGAFACAGQADDAENLTGTDGQGNIAQSRNLVLAGAEDFGQFLDLNNGFQEIPSLMKKPLHPHGYKDGNNRVTTLVYSCLTEAALGSKNTPAR